MMSCKILLVFAFFHIGLTSSEDIEKYTNDLVAEIEGGLVEAEAIAKQMDLELVGEIIPDSNIFQFQRKERIVKRSVNDAKESLQKHPNVKNMFKQKINKRVKRDLTERELSSREQCFVSTIETPTNPSKRCVFPFQYKNTLYQRCTSDHSTNGEQWCATSVSRDGSVLVGEWGDCDFNNVECRVLPPGDTSDTDYESAAEAAEATDTDNDLSFEGVGIPAGVVSGVSDLLENLNIKDNTADMFQPRLQIHTGSLLL